MRESINRESTIQAAVRLALGQRPELVLWRNNTGVALHSGGARVVYGLAPGSSDLIGVLAPSGRFVALEVKSPTGRSSVDQEKFLHLVRSRGGFAAVVRSVDEAHAAIDRALQGADQ